jgi:hypothetical protein
MNAPLTQQDLAQAAKLLERLRTGELNVIPSLGVGTVKEDASTAMLRRVEAFLSEGIRRMDAPIGDGGPAFPVPEVSQNQATGEAVIHQTTCAGLSIRDYFAAKALAGWLAGLPGDVEVHEDAIARRCYTLADAMLKARQA